MTPVVLNLAPTYQALAEISPVQEFTLTLRPTRAAGLDILASEEITLSLQPSRALSLHMPEQERIAVEFAAAFRGERGLKGDAGIQGIQGVKGDNGTFGSVGSQGVQGIQGIQGGRGDPGISGGVTYIYQAGAAISGHRIVTLDDTMKVVYASSGTQGHANRVLGMSVNAAVFGDPVTVQKFGELTEPSWNWQLDKPVYLDVDGGLTQFTPVQPAAKFSLVVGFPISSTSLFINIGFPIILI